MLALVTGGNGFVGRHVVRALRERGHDVLVAGRSRDGDLDLSLDLTDFDNVRDAVARTAPDGVFHLAAQAFVPEATRAPLATYAINAMGTAHVIEAVRSACMPCPRVIIASSAEVYGLRDPADYPLRETLSPSPATPYAASKLAAEAIALASWRTFGVPIIVTRGFNAIGPGQDERFVVSGFAKQLAAVAAGEFPAISVGNLTAQRDFLDVRDVAEAYVALWERGEPGEVYNVCSGKATAIADVLRSLIAATGREVDVRQDPARMRPSDLPVSYGDSSKLSAATGWAPVISLAASLRDAYDDAVARRHAA